MALTFTSGTASLFDRLGEIFYTIESINTFLGSGDISAGGLKSIGVQADAIDARFASSRQDIVSGLYPLRDGIRARLTSDKATLASLAQSVLIQMVNDDTPLVQPTLNYAIKELYRQMVAAPATVNASTFSATVTAGTNNGTATCLASVKAPDGRSRAHLIAETILVTCISDANTGTATAGQETYSIVGTPAADDPLAWNWPKGSGASTTTTSFAADGASTLLTNGDLEDFTVTNAPDNWAIELGSAGTQISSTTDSFAGTNCLRFTGSGGVLTSLYQAFDESTGTTGTISILQPWTVYLFSAWVKIPTASTVPVTGVLEFALTNAAGTILTDDQSVNLSVTRDLTTLTLNTWTLVSAFWCTPRILASTARIRMKTTTTLEAAHYAHVDSVTLTPATEAYPGGPWIGVVPGSTRAAIGDVHSVAIAAVNTGKFQQWMQRCFDMRSLGYQLPSNDAGSESVNDSLIG
jgi:hypothetical protein